MNIQTKVIFDEIEKERNKQNSLFNQEFDDKNTINDWCSYIIMYCGKAITIKASPSEQRTRMVQVATLAIAAIETFDRNNCFASRHYDENKNAK